MSQESRFARAISYLNIFLLGGILGATGALVFTAFGPAWFRTFLLSTSSTSPAASDPAPSLDEAPPVTDTTPAAPPVAEPQATELQEADPGPFTDIDGSYAATEIEQLRQLGVFDNVQGDKFRPQDTITRAEYVRGLLRANNALWFDQVDKKIRAAESGPATFEDVPESHPHFRYIQGLTNAGIAVGFDATTFKPDIPITREQMVAIKITVDKGTIEENITNPERSENRNSAVVINAREFGPWIPEWSDRDKISPLFIAAFNSQYHNFRGDTVVKGNRLQNVERTFGVIKVLKPQSPLTRAEAAMCISLIGDHSTSRLNRPRTAAEALEKMNE